MPRCSAAKGCDHFDCRGRPFLVVFVKSNEGELNVSARVYSSECSTWSAPTSLQLDWALVVLLRPSRHTGDALYFMLQQLGMDLDLGILKYVLTRGRLSVIDVPDEYTVNMDDYMPDRRILDYTALTVDNGSLGFAGLICNILYLWLWQTGPDGNARWTPRTPIDLELLLPDEAMSASFVLDGFVESSFTIFLGTNVGVFAIELQSVWMRKITKREVTPFFPT